MYPRYLTNLLYSQGNAADTGETLHSLIIAKAMTDIKYIQIDVGKTFKEQVLRWFTLHNIPQADSMILTDEHAGDVLGLDYICSVQPFSPTDDIDFTPIFLELLDIEAAMITCFSENNLAAKFPYLVQKKLKEGQDVRRANTAGLECNQRRLQEAICSFILIIHGTSMCVTGGHNWISLSWIQYIRKNPTTLIYVSCRALLIGMTSEFDHPKDKEFLEERSKRKGKDFSKACDGSRISIDL
ncbi:hypothetical protein YC2023_007219 [Brassica napus]